MLFLGCLGRLRSVAVVSDATTGQLQESESSGRVRLMDHGDSEDNHDEQMRVALGRLKGRDEMRVG